MANSAQSAPRSSTPGLRAARSASIASRSRAAAESATTAEILSGQAVGIGGTQHQNHGAGCGDGNGTEEVLDSDAIASSGTLEYLGEAFAGQRRPLRGGVGAQRLGGRRRSAGSGGRELRCLLPGGAWTARRPGRPRGEPATKAPARRGLVRRRLPSSKFWPHGRLYRPLQDPARADRAWPTAWTFGQTCPKGLHVIIFTS